MGLEGVLGRRRHSRFQHAWSQIADLHDHLLKTGGSVSDKRIALDLQDIRDGV